MKSIMWTWFFSDISIHINVPFPLKIMLSITITESSMCKEVGAEETLKILPRLEHGSAQKTYRGHHYVTVTISNNELSFRMYDTSGKLKDYLELKNRLNRIAKKP
jgi:hypothetical protein